jgi:nucleolar protein 12
MSLVASLFGQDSSKKEESTSLFDTSVTIPEPKVVALTETPAQTNEHGDAPVYGPEPQPESAGQVNETDDADSRTVFVGNLPLSFVQRKRKLDQIFQDCGKILTSRLRSVATEGVKLPPHEAGNQGLVAKVAVNTNRIDKSAKQSITGYVVFADEASVELALQKNNLAITDGDVTRHIRVDRVNPEYDAARSIFVGNLPYAADEEELFRTFDDVEAVRVIRDNTTHQCKGFGYILFKEKAGAAAALQKKEVTYKGRVLRIKVCGRRYKSQVERPVEPQRKFDNPVGALRRVLAKQSGEKKKRMRGEKKKTLTAHSSGKSKRAASQAKESQRVKKLEKRISKGMGKTRKGK